jgi:hypothetical protein
MGQPRYEWTEWGPVQHFGKYEWRERYCLPVFPRRPWYKRLWYWMVSAWRAKAGVK